MILKPRLQDLKIIGYYLGKIIIGLALTMIVPIIIGLCFGEANPTLDFIIGIVVSVLCGHILMVLCHTRSDMNWMHGMIVVSLAWLVAMFLGAIPLYLSGHWKCFLDACFDAMSGLATTGLVLVQDLDHLSYAHNFWRHFIMFIGGQGVVVVALSFFVKGSSGAFRMYVGEARDEKILPNVIHTARFIWIVSLTYLVLGTLALGAVSVWDGMTPVNAFFHGACNFMAAFDTGGFAPQSQNILYYHSFLYEIVTVVCMVLGAINFRLHFNVWTGNRKEIVKNIETVTLFVTIMATFGIVAVGLRQVGIYPAAVSLFRKGFYQLVSGHTGTGFQTLYDQQFMADWNTLAILGVIVAMAFGGAVCSTTGAIKMLRIGVIFTALGEDIKRIIMPEKAIVVKKFHHIKTIFLEDKAARSALLITLCYLVLYFLGAMAGTFYGYPFLDSLFESTSAAANVGLSCGVNSVGMPNGLKVFYIFQMWAGRLEFLSIFTLAGFVFAVFRGRK